MSEWTGKNMDKLFREGSENCPFDYNPEAWQLMDALLDRHERRRRLLWWLWVGGIGLALLAALFSFFFFVKRNPATTGLPQQNNPVTVIEPTSKNTGTTHTPEVSNNNNIAQSTLETSDVPEEPSSTKGQAQAPPDHPLQTDLAKTKTSTKHRSAFKPASNPGSDKSPVNVSLSPTVPPPSTLLDGNDATETTARYSHEPNSTPSAGNAPTSTALTDSPDKVPYLGIHYFTLNDQRPLSLPTSRPDTSDNPSLISPPSPLTQPQTGTDDKRVRPANKPSLLIGLLGAAELNSVGQGDYSELNWKLGLQLEYRFAQRWAIKSGANYIHLWYDAGRGEYSPPKGFWVDGIAAASTRGQCDMLEIPLMASYYFKGHQPKKNGFFVSAGATSYILLEEHYWYSYDVPQPNSIFYWGTQKDEMNWFNLGHIAGGYNQHFSKKLSLQIGPYMQFPLTGVGHGKVEIYGIGFQAIMGFLVK